MPSKQQVVIKSHISPVLFMSTDGEPMSFFLRPGPAKRRLQPLITGGGGLLCSVQQPGAILLIDPEERDSVPDTTAHWYVSTHYIDDCIEKEEQLNIEDYRLNPDVAPRLSARLKISKECSSGLSGRVPYSPEDDAAILSYVSKQKTEIGGNRLWQEMEKQRVTSHSWQSMKYRYRVRLAKKSEAEEANTTGEDVKVLEEETKDEVNQETGIEIPSSEEDTVPAPHLPELYPLQVISEETDLTQIYAQPISAESVTENEEAHTLSSPNGEVQRGETLTDAHIAESTKVESVDAETSHTPKPEGLCLDPESDVHPISFESTEAQSAISPQNESMPEHSLRSLPDTPPIKRKVKQKASPKLEQPPRRITRRQLELEASSSPEPYGKKLRSSSYSAEKPFLQTVTKTKSSVKSAHKNDTTVDQPLSKRARGESVAAMRESQQWESEEAVVSETPQTDEASKLLPQKGEKKKEKRKLGILELATKEFEDESGSGEDEASDLQNAAETVTVQPTSTEPCLPPSNTAADPLPTLLNPEPGPNLQTSAQDPPASSSNHVPETSCHKPAATESVHVASRAHLFIFDNESQEDDSQSLVGDSAAAAAQPVVNNAALSLTQAQLEEDMQRIKDLMNQTNQDLASVTKALLKTSGDFSAALNLLSNSASFTGPFWNHYDDSLLLSADPDARQQLQEKYGEEDLAKRVVFLEVEG